MLPQLCPKRAAILPTWRGRIDPATRGKGYRMGRTIAGLILAAPVLLGSSPPGTSVELDASRPLVTIAIDGRPTRIEVAPDGPDGVIVNAAVAQQLGKKGSLIGGRHMVGRTAVSASSNTAKVDYGDGRAIQNRVFWFGRDGPRWQKDAWGRRVCPALWSPTVCARRGRGSVPSCCR